MSQVSFLIRVSCVVGTLFLANAASAVGSAGCGLGSVVFKDNAWWKQVLAATTNSTTGSQTFGITSGTSNCAPGLFGDLQMQKDYMIANLSTLEREVAQGGGSCEQGLAEVMGYAGSDVAFARLLQAHYGEIFNSHNPEVVLFQLQSVLNTNAT